MGNGVFLNGMTMLRRVHENPPPILAPPGPVGAVWNRTIGVNLAIFTAFQSGIPIDAAPTGLIRYMIPISTQMPSLRD